MSSTAAAVQIDSRENPITGDKSVVLVEMTQTVSAAGPTYFLLIDLDNTGGAYKHTDTTAIRIVKLVNEVVKSVIADKWVVKVGVVTTIDGTARS